ncbi:hypothetical protein BHYA_0073g00350 [Botrytis hyacinthi]|uniref:Uncharacterized protein n=1 Tax=Botrytis hyacinthi TaxID=278943 RepID=A0A4Z1GNM0_9HELO|nr:hypothetical protein BHYA_0073g00350 [Botrytis hyacinthi]
MPEFGMLKNADGLSETGSISVGLKPANTKLTAMSSYQQKEVMNTNIGEFSVGSSAGFRKQISKE